MNNDKRGAALSALLTLAMTAAVAEAAPLAIGPALSGDGDGINSLWVRADSPPQNVQNALEVLASANASVSLIGPYIDYRDFVEGSGGLVNSPDLPDPITQMEGGLPVDDAIFAVRFSGFLNVTTSGEYSFRTHSDDGFRLTLGGEVVSIFDGNRSPDSTFATISLDSGLYAIELIGWEQGGQFVDELSWIRPGDLDYAVIGTEAGGRALFTTVPVPASLPLLVGALAGLLLRRRLRS